MPRSRIYLLPPSDEGGAPKGRRERSTNKRSPNDQSHRCQWPNLGRLGVRQPDVYGRQDLDTLRKLCTEWGKDLGLEVEVRQTDDEAEMVHWMHQAADEKTPVVMNPAAFTHYSYALADAAHMVIDENLPLMEVHISNPSARDEFRKRSVISPVATGTITGMGFYGYKLALDAVAHLLSE